MFNYAVTVTRNNAMPHEVSENDYDMWRANAHEKGLVMTDWYYEHDTKGRLHMHGIATHIRSNMLRRSVQLHGFHQRIDILPTWLDLSHWNEYILKDQFREYQFIDQDENGN